MFIVAYFPTKRKEDFTMKKIKNMTAAEAKEAFTKWEVKHPRHDDFDFNSAQIGNYKELFRLADREKSTHRKLAEKQAEVQKREQDRVFNYRSPADRGAR